MLAGEHAAAAGGFVAQSWPVLHSACAFFLAVRLDDALFGRTMDAVQKLAQVCAAFGLDEARNAFMLLLCRGCLPQAAIADHERQLQQSPVAQARGLSAHGHEGTSNARAENSDSGAAVAGSAAGVRALPLVTTSLVSVNFSMNARQVECLRAVVACAQYLAPVLGPTWYPILVTLQQAEEILYQSHRAQAATAASIGSAGSGGASARRGSVAGHGASSGELPSDGAGPLSDLRLVRRDYARLFAFARVCGRDAVMWMVRAMCTLGSDLSNVPAGSQIEADDDSAMRGTASIIHRRLSAVLSRPTFAVEQLRAFAVGNIDLLVGASMDDGGDGDGDGEPVGHAAWLVIMQHLLETTAYLHVPAPIRTQACEAVADIVLAAMGLVARADVQSPETADGEDEPRISERFVELVRSGDAQVCALTPLLQMMTGRMAGHEPPKKSSTNGPADFARFVDVCRLTLDTVHKLLQALGRSIVGAWGVVFDIIRCVLDEPATPMLASTASAEAKQPGFLMRCAFPCLQLICSDYLEDLPAHCLRRCIESMALFGRQTEDLNISLTAIGQAWALCDFLQGVKDAVIDNGRSFGLVSDELAAGVGELAFRRITDEWWQEDLAGLEQPRTRQVLWILLVRSLASLGRDRRHEVRLGAIQTLFRTLEMHGESFDVWMWDGTVWSVVLPLAGYALGQRAHVFELIQQGQLDQLVSDFADPQEEKTQMANKSGVIVEDPARLYRRQWDETATTALQGTARIWAAHSSSVIWDIGFADQAWQFTWRLVQAFFAAEPEFNTDSQGSVVITQDVLCSYLQLCPTIVRQLRAGSWFSEDDSRALLELVRLVLMYVDAPIHSSDDTAMTKLQVLALDSVMLVLATDDAGPGGDKESQRVVDPAAASALVLSELAVLATAPYILRAASEESSGSVLAGGGSTGHSEAVDAESLSMCVAYQVLSGYAVAQRSAAVLARLVKRLDDIDRHNGGADAERGNQARKALADAWTAVGDVLAVALGVSTKPAEGRSYCNADCGRASGLPVRVQIGLLDVVAAASIRYVSADDAADSGQRPAEVVPYWTALVQILERGAELAVEPVVLLGADNGVYGNGDLAPNVVRGADALDGTPQALTMACCKWLFAMSSQTIAVEALLAGTADGVVVATPAWVSEAAVPAMVRRSRAVVEAFVGEHALVGRSPMPLSQIRLLRLVLDGLAHLQCQPGALLQADGVGRARDSAAGRQVLGGSAAHVFAMYDSLVGLLAVPDADILRAVQQCLRRVSAELFG
ncbi:Endocytosis and vacuole integrity protein [Coemansia biformis]|uniref:Endocytosis and vacuole integrity protein n=1 Tax=Coemansia biformis TaxID=1286918 RepID=A0A9W7YAX6_9FUNG|nr:Endocytosis and vacuole integrity protein [Coemansia biformis]